MPSAVLSTVAGGGNNTASGIHSFAAGCTAKAQANGTFVWADNNCDYGNFPVTTENQFHVRASGGAVFRTNLKGAPVVSGVQVLTGASAWSVLSDRATKENFAEVDGKEILGRLSEIPIRTWNWKTQEPTIRHMGPVSQDFYAAFEVGEDDKHISTVDADGVALAAIQGLYQVVKEKERLITEQKAEISELKARTSQLETALAEVLKRISSLEMPSKSITQK